MTQITRRINYTGRRKLKRSEVSIALDESASPPRFIAEFSLEPNLPENAEVCVEAYYRNTLQRFDFGTVSGISHPANTNLTELDLSGPTLFDIKVIDTSDHVARLVACGQKFRADFDESEDARASLMVLKATDLGEDAWRIDFDAERKPVLLINNRIPDAKNRLMHDPSFRSLILPAAMRAVLVFIFLNRSGDDVSEETWDANWISFATRLDDNAPDEDADAFGISIWIDSVVAKLCERHNMVDALIARLSVAED